MRELAEAFNDMLERLENERRDSARRVVRAQEAERRRVARELHDELGQSLTGVLLQIDQAIRVPDEADLEEAREGARRSLDDVRRIARDLRPDTLVELGLASALNALATRFTNQCGVVVDRHLDRDLPALGEDVEVVVYRVAQEALTNIARHAGAEPRHARALPRRPRRDAHRGRRRARRPVLRRVRGARHHRDARAGAARPRAAVGRQRADAGNARAPGDPRA